MFNELIPGAVNLNTPLHNSLFGATKITKDSDTTTVSEDKYSGYGIIFYSKKTVLYTDKKMYARNVMIFGCDNKRNDILVLGENDVEIGKTTIRAEQSLSKNFTVDNKKFVLSVHYNKDDSYLPKNQ